MIANIIADIHCRTFQPLTGWRWFLNRYLRIQFKQGRVVYRLPDGSFVCSPNTVPVLTQFLRMQGYECKVQPKLEVAK